MTLAPTRSGMPGHFGIRIVDADKGKLVGELDVDDRHLNMASATAASHRSGLGDARHRHPDLVANTSLQHVLIALDAEEGEIEFDGNLWPPSPSLDSFGEVVTQQARYLETFWHQFGNSAFIGLLTMVLTVVIGSLASFAVGRMRLSKGSLLTNAALFTYAIPASFLIVPYFRIMHTYGLSDTWAVIAAQVTFATPFAILILQLYGSLIPTELDDSARVDGASAVQVYLRIYLPLMIPALAVVAVYALMLVWNDYLYPSVLLAVRNMTVAVTQGQLFSDTDAAWNAMMAAAIIYVLPPIALLLALRRYVVASLTMLSSGV